MKWELVVTLCVVTFFGGLSLGTVTTRRERVAVTCPECPLCPGPSR